MAGTAVPLVARRGVPTNRGDQPAGGCSALGVQLAGTGAVDACDGRGIGDRRADDTYSNRLLLAAIVTLELVGWAMSGWEVVDEVSNAVNQRLDSRRVIAVVVAMRCVVSNTQIGRDLLLDALRVDLLLR